MIHFHIVTLFPESFSYLDHSIIGRAKAEKKIHVSFYNPRDFTDDRHRTTDDKPYGGGPGMVMKSEPILRAIDKAKGRKKKTKIIVFSPAGKLFTNAYARKINKEYRDVILVAGRYEGVDERIVKAVSAEKISVGPYVLTGGELPAMIVVDAMARQIVGVLGKEESVEETRVAPSEMYTRPEVLMYKKKKYWVPKVLLSGDHKKIEAWRRHRSTKRKA